MSCEPIILPNYDLPDTYFKDKNCGTFEEWVTIPETNIIEIPKIGHAIFIIGSNRQCRMRLETEYGPMTGWYDNRIRLSSANVLPICRIDRKIFLRVEPREEIKHGLNDVIINYVNYKNLDKYFPVGADILWSPNPVLISDGAMIVLSTIN